MHHVFKLWVAESNADCDFTLGWETRRLGASATLNTKVAFPIDLSGYCVIDRPLDFAKAVGVIRRGDLSAFASNDSQPEALVSEFEAGAILMAACEYAKVHQPESSFDPFRAQLGHMPERYHILPYASRDEQPSRDDGQGGRSTENANASNEIVNAVLRYCADNGIDLTREHMHPLASALGEVLENAEAHSVEGKSGSWTVGGFIEVRAGDAAPVVHLAVLSQGRSIYDTLSPWIALRSQIGDRLDEYRQSGGEGLDEEILATIISLQDHISSRPPSPLPTEGAYEGGGGLAKTLEGLSIYSYAFPEEKNLACIASGRCYLRFPAITLRPICDGKTRDCWINRTASIVDEPEPGTTHQFGGSVGGTLFSLRIPLNPTKIRSTYAAYATRKDEFLAGEPRKAA